ncbi:MAG: hemerythrin domain-containing protein [Labilithrix sp.]|nr:hemerythrin domain-containing protein [Labilithrix sp.]
MFRALRRRYRSDALDLMTEGHRQVRAFSRLAVVVAERTDAPLIDVVDDCGRIECFFAEVLPRHVRDEEDSLAPRLRGRSPVVDAALALTHEQHAAHGALVERLCVSTAALRADPGDARNRSSLLAIARPLALVLEAHLRAEEEVIYPAMRTLIPPGELDALGRELRDRQSSERHLRRPRGVKPRD